MKIGVDVTPLQGHLTGVGNYIYPLLQELITLQPESTFYLYSIYSSPLVNELGKYPNVILRQNGFLGKSEALWSQTTLAWLAYRDQLDIFWGSTQSLPLFTRKKQKNLITIYDFAYTLYPQTVSYVRGFYLRLLARRFYKKADVRMTISQGTAKRLEELYALKADSVIIPPLKNCQPAPLEATLQEFKLKKKDYFVMVGTLEPRKNLLAAISAYVELLHTKELPPILLMGKPGWRQKEAHAKIRAMAAKYPNHIKLLGYLPDSEVQALIQGAKAMIMPSLYEGYGMPLAEARTLGTPVICTNVPEMVEAAENDASLIDLSNFKQTFHNALIAEHLSPKSTSYLDANALAFQLMSQVKTVQN